MTYIIGLNGPPNSGKNAISAALVELFEHRYGITPHVSAIAGPLRRIAGEIVGWDLTDDEVYAQFKSQRFVDMGDVTGRRIMIGLTEDYIKPTYGHGLWVRSQISSLRTRKWDFPLKVAIITDVGFVRERNELTTAFEHTAFFSMYRPGCTFEDDSRNYVSSGSAHDHNWMPVHNPGTDPRQLHALAGRIHNFVLNKLHWPLPGSVPDHVFDGD